MPKKGEASVTDTERIDALESENRQLRATLLQWEAIIARHLAWGNHAYERDNPSGFQDSHPPMPEIRRLLLPQPERDNAKHAGHSSKWCTPG